MSHVPLDLVLPEFSTRFARVAQVGKHWCVPAGIENLLEFAGVTSCGQKRQVAAYCAKYGDDALTTEAGDQVLLGGADAAMAIALATNCKLKHENFGVFKSLVDDMVDLGSLGLELERLAGIAAADYADEVRKAIKGGQPCLICARNPDNSGHIYFVKGFVGDQIALFEPWFRTLKLYRLGRLGFSHDILKIAGIAYNP